MPNNNNIDLFAKYGATTILLVAVLIIGVILYLWGRHEGKEWAKSAGIATSIVGAIAGGGAIIYQTFGTPQATNSNSNSSDDTGDQLPA